MLGSAALFAIMGALIKSASTTLPNEMIVFFRSAIGLLALTPWLVRHRWRGIATRRWRGHLVRSLAGLAAMYCYFYSLGHLRLGDATLFNYSSPLFIPLIALLWLREPVPATLWWPIGLGFIGLILILKPGLSAFHPVSLIAMASGVLTAAAMTGIRRLAHTEPAARIVFYFSGVSALISALPLYQAWTPPTPQLWAILAVIGVLATAAQLLMTRAYAQAPAAQIGPFSYATVVFAALAGWIGWGERPDALAVAGMLLVAAAGVVIIRRANLEVAAAGEAPE